VSDEWRCPKELKADSSGCLDCDKKKECLTRYAQMQGVPLEGLGGEMMKRVASSAEPMAAQFIPQFMALSMPETINVLSILVLGIAKKAKSTKMAVLTVRRVLDMIEKEEEQRGRQRGSPEAGTGKDSSLN
jgi:hypothetical protein